MTCRDPAGNEGFLTSFTPHHSSGQQQTTGLHTITPRSRRRN